MATAVMVQGTMSAAGKSVIATGLGRIFAQDGYRVAPFKSQNLATTSYRAEGGEMGYPQVMQAEACGQVPCVAMNPVLLKPVDESLNQLIVNGQVSAVLTAGDFFRVRGTLIPAIMSSYQALARDNDIIVVEAAGLPSDINLRTDDIGAMGLAKLINTPVILVGDIARGGVFAQLVGSCVLLPDDELNLVQGFIITKFRGERSLLQDGLDQLERITAKPVLGVVPYLDLAALSHADKAVRQQGYDQLATTLRDCLDLVQIYRLLGQTGSS